MNFNWDKFYNMEPMKYYDVDDISVSRAQEMIQNKDSQYICTLKSDGEWCRIIKGTDGTIVAQSRNISKVTGEYGNKTELIPHIIKEAMECLPIGTVLLGELCFDDIHTTSRDVGTILRCKAPKAIERQKGKPLYFKVFDCLAFDNIDLMNEPYAERLQYACTLTDYCKEYITMCEFMTIGNYNEWIADILAKGGEGAVIHSNNYLYAPGKRPAWSTLKVKKSTGEIEVPVIATLEPNRLHDGIAVKEFYSQEDREWKYWEAWYKDNPNDKYNTFRVVDPCSDDFYNTTMAWAPVTKPYCLGWKNGILISYNGNQVRVASGLTDADREWLATEEAQELIKKGELYAVIKGMEITHDSIRHPQLIRLRTEK